MAEVRINASGCDRPVLRDLVNHVIPSVANHWYDLGLQLLDPKYENELDIIEGDKNDTKTCCRKMFSKWLKTDELASWDKVIEALIRIGLHNVASNIKQLLGPINNSSSTDDSTDEPVATERGKKKTKSRKGGTKRRKRSVSTQSGVPVCIVSDDRKRENSEKLHTSTAINESPSKQSVVDWLGDFMKGQYCNMRLKKLKEEKDPWPPVKTKCYITLALMYQKDLQTRDETTKTIFLRTKGDISDIPEKINSQMLTDITQIFSSQSGSIPNSILIEGHPGIGKTTLVKEICVEWAEGKLLTSDKLVLLLLLRDPNVQRITNVQQLIEHFTHSTSKVTQLHSYLEDNHGADVALIIDGFDELSNTLRGESFFVQLINRKVLPKAKIVVSSRPTASVCLHDVVDRRIEILGFDQTSRLEYANEALQDTPSKLEKLQKHFQQYPSIDAICYIPLIMSIIVFLCMCQPEDLPPTASKMYHSFVLHTICHYLKRTGKIAKDEHINKMVNLPQTVREALWHLKKVAFDGLVEDKIVFTMDDLPDMCRDDSTCYGLLQSVECYCSDEIGTPTKSFNFLHLGIQEYFAAKYVATLPEDEVYTLMKESFLVTENDDPDSKSVRLSNMWIMYCGVTSGQCNSLRYYLSPFKQYYDDANELMNSLPQTGPSDDNQQGSTSNQEISNTLIISQHILKNPVEVLYLFQCFQEAQDDNLCDILSKSFDSGKIDLSHHRLLPHQVVSLGFFLSRSHRKWKELNLYKCHIGYHCINLLHHYLCGDKTNKPEITTIDLSNNYLTVASSPLICDIITYLQPHTLMLTNNNITSVRDISTAVINTNTVKVLDMRNNGLTAQEASAISDMMTCLEELDISNNDGAVTISKGITKTNTPRLLDIDDNNITSTGPIAIANSLLHNTSLDLEVPDMSSNAIGKDGATAIAQVITNNKTLKKLNIHRCNITATGTTAIANSLLHYTSLEVLDMSYNAIGKDGATAIAQVITNNKTLKKLNIHRCNITATGTTAIANSLLHNTSLEVLDISYNDIDECGATAIARAIIKSKTLKKLSLYDDTMNKYSAMIIISSLHHNNSITKLKHPYALCHIVNEEVEHINRTRRKCNIQELEVM